MSSVFGMISVKSAFRIIKDIEYNILMTGKPPRKQPERLFSLKCSIRLTGLKEERINLKIKLKELIL